MTTNDWSGAETGSILGGLTGAGLAGLSAYNDAPMVNLQEELYRGLGEKMVNPPRNLNERLRKALRNQFIAKHLKGLFTMGAVGSALGGVTGAMWDRGEFPAPGEIVRAVSQPHTAPGVTKTAGGPGSGVIGRNTKRIPGFPLSKHIGVGTRKSVLEHMPYEITSIPLSKITHVAQEKFVPKKLKKMLKDADNVGSKPIDVLQAPGEVTCVDGHHRFLLAILTGKRKIPAKLYTSRQLSEKTS